VEQLIGQYQQEAGKRQRFLQQVCRAVMESSRMLSWEKPGRKQMFLEPLHVYLPPPPPGAAVPTTYPLDFQPLHIRCHRLLWPCISFP
jgi:hypothetical protein